MDLERRRGRLAQWRRSLVVALLAWALAGAAAADPPPSLAERLLDIMLEKQVIDEGQYRELREQAVREAELLRAAAEAAPAAGAEQDVAAARDAGPEWNIWWDQRFRLERSDGRFALEFGGRMDLDGSIVDESRALSERVGGEGTGTGFRRARILFAGELYEHFLFKAEYDFADGEAGIRDLWAGLRRMPWVHEIRAGHMKEPFSLEQLASARFIAFMERPLPDALVPARNTGLAVNRTFLDEAVTLGVGAFNDTDRFGNGFQNDSNYNLSARVSGVPWYRDDGRRLLHLGASYSHGFRGDGVVRYRSQVDNRLLPPLLDTGSIPGVDGVDLVGGELAVVHGPVRFQAEGIASFLHRSRGLPNPSFWGAYGELSWFLTGESREYIRAYGIFGGIDPRRDFDLRTGGWGAFELALRYSYLDLQGGGIAGGIAGSVAAALNWYLYPNFRIMLNYVLAHRHGLGDASVVESRIGYFF